jgi:hypothetical protein
MMCIFMYDDDSKSTITDELLSHVSADLAAVLVKAATAPPADERQAGSLPQGGAVASGPGASMSSHDLHTFTTR